MYESSIVIFMPKTFYWMSSYCSHDLDSFRIPGCMSSYLSLAVQVQSTKRSEPSAMDSTKCLQDSVVHSQAFWDEQTTSWEYLLLQIKQIYQVFCEDLPVWIGQYVFCYQKTLILAMQNRRISKTSTIYMRNIRGILNTSNKEMLWKLRNTMAGQGPPYECKNLFKRYE
jgi:hypothetical protein